MIANRHMRSCPRRGLSENPHVRSTLMHRQGARLTWRSKETLRRVATATLVRKMSWCSWTWRIFCNAMKAAGRASFATAA
eukprot:12017026-Karenia_brevis.AAC.1